MAASQPDASRDLPRITLSVLGIVLLILGSLWILRPFLGALLWAGMIVVSTWPLLRGLERRLGGRRGPAVAVMTLALLLVVVAPLSLAVATIVRQSDRITALARGVAELRVPSPPAWVEGVPVVGADAAAQWRALAAEEPAELAARVTPYLRSALAWFAEKAGGFAGMLLDFLLTVVISAVLYARGEKGATLLRRFFRRLSGERGEAMVALAGKAIRAVALGIVVTAGVQTTIAGAGLAAAGVPFAGFLTALVLVLCIAQIGPLPVMAPAVVWLFVAGAPGRATVLIVAGVVASIVDGVLRPALIRKGADLSLLLVFPGVIGGLLWLGIVGLFVGPVLLAVTANLLESWIASGETEAAPPVVAAAVERVAEGAADPSAPP